MFSNVTFTADHRCTLDGITRRPARRLPGVRRKYIFRSPANSPRPSLIVKTGQGTGEYGTYSALPDELRPFFVPTLAAGTFTACPLTDTHTHPDPDWCHLAHRSWVVQECLDTGYRGAVGSHVRRFRRACEAAGFRPVDLHPGQFLTTPTGIVLVDYSEWSNP